MTWETITAWIFSFGEYYGVNPFIFALLYFGTIPLSLFSFIWVARNVRKGKKLFFPVLLAFGCFIGTYLYLFAVGKNIPLWVYGIIVLMMIYSGNYLRQKLKQVS